MCCEEKNIHESYKEALFGKKTFWHGMKILPSERHEIYGMHVNKISLSPFDSMHWISKDRVNTITYGHKDLN